MNMEQGFPSQFGLAMKILRARAHISAYKKKEQKIWIMKAFMVYLFGHGVGIANWDNYFVVEVYMVI